MDSARNTPNVHALASELLACAWALKDSPQVAVRRGVIVALAVGINNVRPEELLGESLQFLEAVTAFVDQVCREDPDEVSRKSASGLLKSSILGLISSS